jgi:two-component system, NarL family, nitrate/nitrite response regulator NarL
MVSFGPNVASVTDDSAGVTETDPAAGTESEPGQRPIISVVIVDDHLMVADSLAATLDAQDDIKVAAVADSCASGLAAVARHRPDVLLLDQRLPDGLGTDSLAAMLQANPPMKVLLVTGGDSDDVLARAIMAGAAGVIPKGKRAANLVAAVRAVANDEAVITPDALRRLMPRLTRGASGPGDDLTAREREVLQLLVAGTSTSALAGKLFVAPATARNHIQSIMNKLGAHSRLEAVAIALRENILARS